MSALRYVVGVEESKVGQQKKFTGKITFKSDGGDVESKNISIKVLNNMPNEIVNGDCDFSDELEAIANVKGRTHAIAKAIMNDETLVAELHSKTREKIKARHMANEQMPTSAESTGFVFK